MKQFIPGFTKSLNVKRSCGSFFLVTRQNVEFARAKQEAKLELFQIEPQSMIVQRSWIIKSNLATGKEIWPLGRRFNELPKRIAASIGSSRTHHYVYHELSIAEQTSNLNMR
jgi:hypothetical protein